MRSRSPHKIHTAICVQELGTRRGLALIALQFAYRSIAYLLGDVEDVLIKVDKFIFLVDFVVIRHGNRIFSNFLSLQSYNSL